MENSIPYIYLVDDSDVNLKYITSYIKKRFDCKVRPFKTAEDCLKIIDKREPNILLSDFHLNDFDERNINGDKLLLKVRKKHPNVSTLLYSSDFKINSELVIKNKLDFIPKDQDFNVALFTIVKNNLASIKARKEIEIKNVLLYMSILLWISGFYLTSVGLEILALVSLSVAILMSFIYGYKSTNNIIT